MGEEKGDGKSNTGSAPDRHDIARRECRSSPGANSGCSERRGGNTQRFSDNERGSHNPCAGADLPQGDTAIDQTEQEEDNL